MNNRKIRIGYSLLSFRELDPQGSVRESLELVEQWTSVLRERGSKPEGTSTVQLEKLMVGPSG
jgi:hypothetical protein